MAFKDLGIGPAKSMENALFTIRPVTLDDVQLDYEAVMESREFLRLWEQSTWPEDDFTVEANRDDIEKMVGWFEDGYAFGYTVMNPDETECLGCVYVFAPDARMYEGAEVTQVGDLAWSDVEATVYFWARKSAVERGHDRDLLDVIRPWCRDDWAFGPHVFVTTEPFVQQVAMIEQTDLELAFTFRRPKDAEPYRAYR